MGLSPLALVLLSVLGGSYAQICTLITSNVLRVDSEETFIVDGHGTAFDAEIIIQEFPDKSYITQKSISVNNVNGFLGTTKFLIPSTSLKKDPEKKQFVYVVVRSNTCNLQKVVLVSYQRGYIFLQTDKPIYTPGSLVLYRTYGMTPDLKPSNKMTVIEVLTPDNVIVNNRKILHQSGIMSSSYKLPESASLGVWTLVAKFEDTDVHTYTTKFEVKEYTMPSLEVKIKAAQKFYYINDREFKVDIEANYLYGKPVHGMAYVLFSVTRESERKSLTDTLRRIQIEHGKGSTALRREDLVKYFKQEKEMLEWRLSVSATVITESGSDMVENELTDIPMVTSPYKVLYTKTSKFFKPGMPMDLMVFVTNPVGTPADRVPVVAEPGSVRGVTLSDGTVRLTINTRTDISSIDITVTTDDRQLLPTQQASAALTVTAYQPLRGNYLHLSIGGGGLKVGQAAYIHFINRNNEQSVQNQITHFNYIILNKGRIMRTGRLERLQGQSLVTLPLQITPEFIPSFRILAYYVVTTGAGREIVADSLWIDVADTCMGTLKISGERDRDNADQFPGSSMRLRLEADHKASVGLVVVDKGAYIMNGKYRMSQTKVWDLVERYDTGCTAGGGADAAGVFYDAGLALENSFHGSTPQRSEVFCQVKLKRKRDTASLFQIQNDDGDEDLEYIDESDIILRTYFPESWLWRIEIMNEIPDYKGVSSKLLRIFLKDTITTWEVLAVSFSEDNGICVAEPYEINTKNSFLIDLKLPYSVSQNEEVELQAVVVNLRDETFKVRVTIPYNSAFCSIASVQKSYRMVVTVPPKSSATVPFVIVPLELGNHEVEVKASTFSQADGIKKQLRVMAPSVSSDFPMEKGRSCNGYNLTVTVKTETMEKMPENAIQTVSITICISHLGSQGSATSILDITMLTGFSLDVNDLYKQKKVLDEKSITDFEFSTRNSDKNKLILYLNKISQAEKCLKLKVHQLFKVGRLQPASISLYDIHSPKNHCTRYYNLDGEDVKLGRICQESVCRCADSVCSFQFQFDVQQILAVACQGGSDYVYKVYLTNIQPSDSYDAYVMRIEEVLKPGTDVVTPGETRTFLSSKACRITLNFLPGRSYLVSGVSSDLWKFPDSKYKYIIGRNTWIERWLTDRECQYNQKRCDDLLTFADNLKFIGCTH
ncbi:A.superbus venom factor 1-like [Aquarana catesbeiana]|uniref:A.superbus venom factor 1-like n=1 Tax=Aquarana catesbeiana TaxID=8400 RepID=UPI003CCA0D89